MQFNTVFILFISWAKFYYTIGDSLHLSTDQLALADRHDQGIHPGIGQGAFQHGRQRLTMADGVICDEQAALDQPWNDQLIAVPVYVLLRIQEYKSKVIV